MNKIKPIYDAFIQHTKQYDSGDTDYSVTTLQDPPRIVQLTRRYGHLVPFAVESWLPSLMGTAIHEYIERMLLTLSSDDYKLEERLARTVLNRKVSGAYDIFHVKDLELYDIKTSKAYNLVYNDREHWTAQQNIYRSLIREHHGLKLRRLNIIFWSWQWDKFTMMKNKQYPRQQIQIINLPLWSDGRTREYMEERVQLMIDSEKLSDTDLPHCEPEEMWSADDVFAVKRTDRKNALRLLPSKKSAQDFMNTYQQESGIPITKFHIEHRPGIRRRCEDWCPVNKWCDQWTEYCSLKGN